MNITGIFLISIIILLFILFNFGDTTTIDPNKSDNELLRDEIKKTRNVIKNRLNIIILILLLPLIFILSLIGLGISLSNFFK